MRALQCLAVLACSLMALTAVQACSRLVWFTDQYGLFVTRTEDWSGPTRPTIEVRAAGQAYVGADRGDNAVSWQSKYASMMITFHRVAGIEGFNEAGLSVSALSLAEEDAGEYNPAKLQLDNTRVVPYLLDNFDTVKAVLDGLEQVQIQQVVLDGNKVGGHYAFSDITGDSAVVELIDGEMRVYHGPQYRVVTNSPTYDLQLEHWERVRPKPSDSVDGTYPVPGNVYSDQRFVRNSYMLEQLRPPTSFVNGILKLESTVYKIPHDAANRPIDGVMAPFATEYSATYNLNQKRLFIRYQYGDAYTHYFVDFDELNNGKNWVLEADRADLFGDVTEQFIQRDGIMAKYRLRSPILSSVDSGKYGGVGPK